MADPGPIIKLMMFLLLLHCIATYCIILLIIAYISSIALSCMKYEVHDKMMVYSVYLTDHKQCFTGIGQDTTFFQLFFQLFFIFIRIY